MKNVSNEKGKRGFPDLDPLGDKKLFDDFPVLLVETSVVDPDAERQRHSQVRVSNV